MQDVPCKIVVIGKVGKGHKVPIACSIRQHALCCGLRGEILKTSVNLVYNNAIFNEVDVVYMTLYNYDLERGATARSSSTLMPRWNVQTMFRKVMPNKIVGTLWIVWNCKKITTLLCYITEIAKKLY